MPLLGEDGHSDYEAQNKAALTNQLGIILAHNHMLDQKDVLIPATLRLLGFKD